MRVAHRKGGEFCSADPGCGKARREQGASFAFPVRFDLAAMVILAGPAAMVAGLRSTSAARHLVLRRYINLLEIDPTTTLEASAPSIDGSPRVLRRAKDLGPGAAAVVQTSTDLVQWSQVLESPPAAERTALTLDSPALAGRRFFRLVQ